MRPNVMDYEHFKKIEEIVSFLAIISNGIRCSSKIDTAKFDFTEETTMISDLDTLPDDPFDTGTAYKHPPMRKVRTGWRNLTLTLRWK